MAKSYTFPDIEEPILPRAENGSSSFGEALTDSLIESTSDAMYRQTRPGASRVTGKWTFAWNSLSEEDYKKLRAFFMEVKRSESFQWTNPIDNQTYTVRFASEWNWIYDYPVGWRGVLTFEEV